MSCKVQGKQSPNALALSFCFSRSDPLTWFQSGHSTTYLLRHLLQHNYMYCLLCYCLFCCRGVVADETLSRYMYINAYMDTFLFFIYVLGGILSLLLWRLDLLFHSMLCCTFKTIDTLWFWFWYYKVGIIGCICHSSTYLSLYSNFCAARRWH